MGKIKYTVTTLTKRCSNCGQVIETETHGAFEPLLACFCYITFPIRIAYALLNILAFSSPIFKKIGPKYCQCPSCLEIVKTDNYYVEELYGEYLLNYKFNPLFYLAYGFGSVLIFTLLSFLFEISTTSIAITIVCCCVIAGITISYRVLLAKYKCQSTIPSENIPIIEKKQELEFIKLYEKLHKQDLKENGEAKEQRIDNSFVSNFEQKVSNHRKWRDDNSQGEQLIVKKETIKNVDMKGIKLQSSKFIECTFKKMDLSNTSLRRCDLSNTRFVGCNLTKTDFTGAVLDNVKFIKCNTNDAIYKEID